MDRGVGDHSLAHRLNSICFLKHSSGLSMTTASNRKPRLLSGAFGWAEPSASKFCFEGFPAYWSEDPLKRFRTAPTAPNRPVPNSSMLVGSGTVLLVICPWTVVIPLFEAGGTRFSGLLVIEYVTPPMVTAVVVKLTTPVPELEALNDPLKVAEKLSLPAIGTLWVIVRVKVPDAAMV